MTASTPSQDEKFVESIVRTNYCGFIDKQYLGQQVTLFGWAHRRRDHGGVIFIDLRDREGLVQVVIDPDTPDAFQTADKNLEA